MMKIFLEKKEDDDFILLGGADGDFQAITKKEVLLKFENCVIEVDEGHIYDEEIGFFVGEDFHIICLV